MSLEQWLRNSWLQTDEVTLAEIQALLQVVERDLRDAQAAGLSADGRFMHAYDAALQLCVVALRATGYRVPKGQGQHKRSIDSLRFTLGASWAETADHLERCSRMRGQAVYERIGVVEEKDSWELVATTRQLHVDVVDWLKRHHDHLVPRGF